MDIQTPTPPAPATMQAAIAPVDLNTVIREVFECRKERMDRFHTILRCDVMPEVAVPAGDLVALFGKLVDQILEQPPVDSHLFIYVKCEPGSCAPAERWTQHHISLHSNGRLPADPLELQAFLQQTEELCNRLGGSFSHHLLSRSSCFFHINLPGKISSHASR